MLWVWFFGHTHLTRGYRKMITSDSVERATSQTETLDLAPGTYSDTIIAS